MIWTDNPSLDAERDYNRKSANQRMWENENYRGTCPVCGKAMFEDAWDIGENAVEDMDYGNEDGYIHEWCLMQKREEEAEREAVLDEAFNDMMGNPMETLASLKVTA